MELIDKNALLNDNYCNHCLYHKSKSCDDCCERMGHNIVATRRMIEDAPAIDAVPVVKCNDCKCWGNEQDWGNRMVGLCELFDIVTDADGYCYRADRKEVHDAADL